jgi:hypothetical protein
MGDLLKGPIAGIVEGIGSVLGKFVTDPNAKLQAQLELSKLEMEFREKVLAADVEYAKAQAGVITTEAGSKNWLASSWRPILMLTFTYIILHNYVLAPLFHAPAVAIPADMWELLRIGMGGYVVGRTVEKVAPSIAQAISNKK